MKAQNGKYTIGVLIGNAHTSHPKELMAGVASAAKEKDVNVIFFLGTHSSYVLRDIIGEAHRDCFDYQFNSIYDYALLADVDALIVAYGTVSLFLENKNKKEFFEKFGNIPYVVLEEGAVEGQNGTSVQIDNYGGMKANVEHLIEKHGYHKIVYLSGPKDVYDSKERLRGYRDAMKEHNLSITDSMIEYGDYSDTKTTEELVEKLLDSNEDIEAIVCANDTMSVAAYKVCNQRDMVVGCDMAITGFDDVEYSKSMNPPLTTVSQNGYVMGYRAITSAIDMCENKAVEPVFLPADCVVRSSCGCEPIIAEVLSEEMLNANLEKKAEYIVEKCYASQGEEVYYRQYVQKTYRLLQYLVEKSNTMDNSAVSTIKLFLNILLDDVTNDKDFSISELAKELFAFMTHLQLQCTTRNTIKKIAMINGYIQEYLQAKIVSYANIEMTNFKYRAWIIPFISRDFIGLEESESALYLELLPKLHKMGAKSSYIYLLPQPIMHKAGETFSCPEKMWLCAYHIEDSFYTFNKEECPIVTMQKGVTNFFEKGAHTYMSFLLFSGETIYGILLCEIETKDIDFFYTVSLQLGHSLHYLEISNRERAILKKLDETLKDLKNKNEILSMISEYDDMTGLLNRRGFSENIQKLTKEKIHGKAYFIIADLDHLKEINDTFGHVEGDYAITKAGQILTKCLDSGDVLCRYGGDEFMAVAYNNSESFAQNFYHKVKEVCAKENENSMKPYLVEISLGITSFVLNEEEMMEHQAIMKLADDALYEDKKRRRESVKK